MENFPNITKQDKELRNWYALYTRPRFEKAVDSELHEKGIESFLPLQSVIRYWSDRKKKVEVPLFPSYVFVHANLSERYRSLQTRGVVKMICFNGQPARIPDGEIQRFHRILNSGLEAQPHSYLKNGDEVEVSSGPLMGLKGFYIEDRSKGRIVISVHTIQQSISLELDRCQVRRIYPSQKSVRKNCAISVM